MNIEQITRDNWPDGPEHWDSLRINAGNRRISANTHVDGVITTLPDTTIWQVPMWGSLTPVNYKPIVYRGFRKVNSVRAGVDPWTSATYGALWTSGTIAQNISTVQDELLDALATNRDADGFFEVVWWGELESSMRLKADNDSEYESAVMATIAPSSSRVLFTGDSHAGTLSQPDVSNRAGRIDAGKAVDQTVPLVIKMRKATNPVLGTNAPIDGVFQMMFDLRINVQRRQWKLPCNSINGPFRLHLSDDMRLFADDVGVFIQPFAFRQKLAAIWYDGTPGDSSDDWTPPEPQP